MNKKIEIRRVPFFIIGLFLMAFGIALSVKADFGVTPISCIPYIFSMYSKFTFGEVTVAFNVLFVLIQIFIVGRTFPIFQFIQIFTAFLLGYFVDIAMFLLSWMDANTYVFRIEIYVASCLILALGMFFIVEASVTYIPASGLIVVISKKMGRSFGGIKIFFDVCLVLTGIAISLFFFEKLIGIGVGTVFAAIFVGLFVKLYRDLFLYLGFIEKKQ